MDLENSNFEIEISKPIINNIFLEKKIKSLKINGLHCFDRLECYINLFQHEIVHLLIAIFCTKDGYGMGGHTVMFRNIALFIAENCTVLHLNRGFDFTGNS